MQLDSPVSDLKGVGSKIEALFERLGISTVADLIEHYPRRYNDFSQITKVSGLRPGEVSIKASITSSKGRYVRRGLHITEAVASDDSGSVRIIWFNQPYRMRQIKNDQEYFISGEYGLSRNRYAISNPAMEAVSSDHSNTARIVPIYPETKGLKSYKIRSIINQMLSGLSLDSELDKVLKPVGMLTYKQAIKEIHFPTDTNRLEAAKARIGFEEVFELILAAAVNRQELGEFKAPQIEFKENTAKDFVGSLDFDLTDSQRQAAWKVLNDISKTTPMNRLVEGDVGSGKTVVAAMAGLMAFKSNLQVAYMAPTDILATQQYQNLKEMLSVFDVEIVLIKSNLKSAQRKKIEEKISSGQADIIVGTHALFQKSAKFRRLGLIIIDEQHRFGVEHRKALMKKAKALPHVLTMTATPIPRTLALVVYGELDISIISELPKGRVPVETSIVPPASITDAYKLINHQIEQGRQAYVVYPIIEDSEVLSTKSATRQFEKLKNTVFKQKRVALVHGRLNGSKKDEIMSQFAAGKIDVLVSTTVIEVGVDVPNATVMMIEGAERFGLAQLHQLRGRVGRSTHQSYCVLVPSDNLAASKRLRAMETINDGFKLSEMDLELRGPGSIYGQRQHGLIDLRMANLADSKTIAKAKKLAEDLLKKDPDLVQYPRIKKRIERLRKVSNLN